MTYPHDHQLFCEDISPSIALLRLATEIARQAATEQPTRRFAVTVWQLALSGNWVANATWTSAPVAVLLPPGKEGP